MKRVNLMENPDEEEPRREPLSSRRGLIVLLVVVLLLLGGLAAGYFGYYLPRVRESMRTARLAEEERKPEKILKEPEETLKEEEEAEVLAGESETLREPRLFEPIRPEERARAESPARPKEGERLVSEEVTPEPPPEPREKAQEKAEVTPTPPPPPPREPEAEKEPPPAKAPPPESPPEVKAPAEKQRPAGSYSVRVASCLFDECVRALKERLKAQGYDSHVRGVTARLIRYEVRVASPLPPQSLQDLRTHLEKAGIKVKERKVGGNRVQLVAGPYIGLEDARLVMDRLQQEGVKGRVVGLPGPVPMKEVRVGRFESRASAQRLKVKLERRGFEADIVKR